MQQHTDYHQSLELRRLGVSQQLRNGEQFWATIGPFPTIQEWEDVKDSRTQKEAPTSWLWDDESARAVTFQEMLFDLMDRYDLSLMRGHWGDAKTWVLRMHELDSIFTSDAADLFFDRHKGDDPFPVVYAAYVWHLAHDNSARPSP